MNMPTWLLLLSCAAAALALGGGIYESIVIAPQWSAAPPSSFSIIQKSTGVPLQRFWIPVHAAITMLLLGAVVANWKVPDRRYLILAAVASYIVMRVWRLFRKRYVGFTATILIVAAVALLVAVTGCVHTRAFRDNHGRPLSGSMARMERVRIGGIQQSIWFRGANASNPVLIFLHGGPGISGAPLFRHYNSDLEHYYRVIYWEQRGAGRSFHRDIPPSSMNIDQFLRDLDEVVERVRHRFNKQKVVLLAHSWGTVLGTIYARRHPQGSRLRWHGADRGYA